MKHNYKKSKESIKEKTINLDKSLHAIADEIIKESENISNELTEEINQREEMNSLIARVNKLNKDSGISSEAIESLVIAERNKLNESLDALLDVQLSDSKSTKFPKLTNNDVIIASISGLIAVAIDVLLVGTPDMVKVYPGGTEQLDGSVLTKVVRRLSNETLSGLGNELSKIVKVPYDISVNKGGNYPGISPNNHRLKSLSHDPFFGLFFAIFDIVFNTFTFIDDLGNLRVTVSDINRKKTQEKFLAVFFYIGHIISDLHTSRGIPVPGFFLTQFFTTGNSEQSFAIEAEKMYKNGYDLRHMTSMSVTKFAREMIIDFYLSLIEESNTSNMPIADKERIILNNTLIRDKMMFVSNSISVTGNAIKFFSPPYSCNPNSLNAVEWFSFLTNSISIIKANNRDTTGEQTLVNRDEINKSWSNLIDALDPSEEV